MSDRVRADDHWRYRGFTCVRLENSHIRADIFPELGAKIYNLIHQGTRENLLWHHPRIELRAAPLGASYDDNFCGGWDELFPNDAADRIAGEPWPDHGELWSQPWDYDITSTADEATVYLRRAGSVTHTVVEKWITLRAGEDRLRFRHRISNVGPKALDFLWKLHPALAIEEGDRLDLPGKTAEVVSPDFGLVREPAKFPWPVAKPPGQPPVDFSVIRAMNGTRDFLYVDAPKGWCALRRMRSGIGFGLSFPTKVFPSVWLFMTFGGWRGLETLVLEPCTTVPKDLNEAIRRGTCSHLDAGQALDCEIVCTVFEGREPVRDISAAGDVIR